MIRLFKRDILHFLKSLTEFEVKNIENYVSFLLNLEMTNRVGKRSDWPIKHLSADFNLLSLNIIIHFSLSPKKRKKNGRTSRAID